MPERNPNRDDLIGQTIAGRYRTISRLGAGGMGTAYRAWDEQDGVPVVIKIPKKVFLEDPKFAERFHREIRLLQGLKHPHIVPIVDVGTHEGLPFVVMRFLPGGSLSNRRLRDDQGKVRPNPPGMLHLWLPAVAEALDYVHSQGVVHRDVKPANIFFDASWGAYLGDFGIAKVVEESDTFEKEHTLTATHMGIGTQEYMCPEQFTPKAVIDGRADQYALAVMAYEMLAGTRPFTGATAHLIVEVTTQAAPRLDRQRSGLPSSLVQAVHRGLAKRPQERFGTCREFADEVLRDVPPLADEPDIARLLCPKCSNILRLPVAAAGRKGKCPKCQTEMKVAEDLGALWLLDEARRQRKAKSQAGVASTGSDEEGVEDEPAGVILSDEEPLETFKPVSSTTPIGRSIRARRGPSEKVLSAMLVGVLALAMIVLGGRVLSKKKKPTKAATSPVAAVAAEDLAADSAEAPAAKTKDQKPGPPGKTFPEKPDVKPLPRGPLDDGIKQADEPAPADPAQQQGSFSTLLAQPPLINSIGMKLKLIPAGTFMMGSEDGEADEKPVHQVRITEPFYLGVHEVTNAQWKLVMGVEPPSRWKDDNRPVEQVTWEEADTFCRRLSEREPERTARRKYRLPTEAEWEYACRAGTTTRFSFGNDEAALVAHAWVPGNANGHTHPVGQKKANAWGLHDMHGNVWEWCNDSQGSNSVAPAVDHRAPLKGSVRISRGGSWASDCERCRAAYRQKTVASSRWDHLGLRVALMSSGSNSAIPNDPNLLRTDSNKRATADRDTRPDPGTLSSLQDNVGTTYSFHVLGSGTRGHVWGSNPYTADSQLAKAAVHAGALKPGQSGVVRVTVLPGQPSFASSTRNGVRSGRWSAYGYSYRIEETRQDLTSDEWYQVELKDIGMNPGSIESTNLPVRADSALQVGQVLQVRWSNTWWGARVLQLLPDGMVRVRYLGWPPVWDVTATRDRLQFDDNAIAKARRTRTP
jgi:formylglycine-generating enzyme required for sulfatase activity/serine/threonine protein kinase